MPNVVDSPRKQPPSTTQRLEALRAGLGRREASAVQQFAELVLDALAQLDGFPRRYDVVASPDALHLVVQWQLPAKTIVPEAREVRYLRAKDEKRYVARSPKESAARYRGLVAQVSLLVV